MNASEGPLADRRVLVTGASSGIGAATVRACAAAGARVAATARRVDRLQALGESTGCTVLPGDLTDEHAARGVVEAAVDALGGLDGLVNNAGVMRPGLVADGRVEDWRAMFELNVLALLVVTQAALPHLTAAARGDVVNISSMSGRRVPSATGGVYSASKFAVHALSEGLRLELGETGTRVTVIAPGFVRTELFDHAGEDPASERFRTLQSEVGLEPEVVADQVVHVLRQPPQVNLREVALTPTAQGS
jgi:NADP-dependent 3-hydroxy acid dehydrogenase YdfG